MTPVVCYSIPTLIRSIRVRRTITYISGAYGNARVSQIRADLIAKGLRPAVILGGDLNSPPFGPVRYLMGELIGPDSDLWANMGSFEW